MACNLSRIAQLNTTKSTGRPTLIANSTQVKIHTTVALTEQHKPLIIDRYLDCLTE
jgi:hypothetical protein